MNYYYDIVLNFSEENYLFYEWDEKDNLEYIKKIPLYQVSSETFHDFYQNSFKVSPEFLTEIENKTIKKSGKLKYACIFADKNNALAYEFASDGNSLTRSALLLSDELSLLEYLYTVPTKDINYNIGTKRPLLKEMRISSQIKKVITMEIDKLYKEKYLDKLQYLYIEWFGKKEENPDIIYKQMQNKLKKEIDEDALKIYNIIKLSYNNV